MAVAGTGKLTAVGAIVIGCYQEGSVRVDRFTVKGQMLNTLCLRVDRLAFAVLAGGL